MILQPLILRKNPHRLIIFISFTYAMIIGYNEDILRNHEDVTMKHHFSSEFKKRGISAALCILFLIFLFFGAAFVPGCSSERVPGSGNTGSSDSGNISDYWDGSSTDDSSFDAEVYTAAFDAFTEEIFRTEITANTINLHFTLAHPENYGITDYEVTLGDLSLDAIFDAYARQENYLATLKQFDKEKLPLTKQITYDLLKKDFESSLSVTSYLLYDEFLAPSSGLHAQLPILFEEYLFYDEGDIKDYLTLLRSTKDYFVQVIAFEKEKAANGLFMADFSCESVISQCKDFIAAADNHFLIETFNKRVNAMDTLSEESKKAYIAQNEKLVKEDLVAAYQYLADEMTALLGKGKNDKGLCYLTNGRDYYEYLVYYYTGSDAEVYDIQKMISDARTEALMDCAVLADADPSIYQKINAATLAKKDAAATLDELKLDMLDVFPSAPETAYTVNIIDECIADYVAPAYYITPPIDDYSKNYIHINQTIDATTLEYFTTLAHEGFPGHLYQTVMSYETDIDLVRNLLYFGGYTEGWATYVEMISYGYAAVDPDAAHFLQQNQSALLSLYASTDLGIHYDGWTREETAEFWANYGITDPSATDWIYEYIVGEPGSYLKYYVGYLEFLSLKEYAMTTFGNDYNDIDFHQALLDIGPATFDVVEAYLADYYKK